MLRASFEAKGPCAPCAPTRRGPQLYLFQWTRGGISERAGGRASGLPHLGGSEKLRVTAPHLAGPPLASTSLPGAGRRGGAGGGDRSRGRPTLGRERWCPWLLYLMQVKFNWAREG